MGLYKFSNNQQLMKFLDKLPFSENIRLQHVWLLFGRGEMKLHHRDDPFPSQHLRQYYFFFFGGL